MNKNLSRLGARTGSRIRKNIGMVRANRLRTHRCVGCQRFSLRRVSTGLWECRTCQFQIAREANSF